MFPAMTRPPNALPLSGGRPSAADRPLQRLYGFDSLEADHRLQTSTLIPDMRTSYRCPFQVASIV
jgi:hypothetical protein